MLDFASSIILENNRVRLSPLTEDHIKDLMPFAINEPYLWQYSLQSADGEENMKNYLKSAIDKRRIGDSYPFIVFDKKNNTIAGSTRFYDYQEHHRTIQLGYTWYGKEFWGTGLNKACKYLMLEFAFDECGMERVEFRADNNNKRSIAAMKSLGCQVEGILRSNCASPKGRRDSIILSILKNEWDAGVKDNLYKRIRGK